MSLNWLKFTPDVDGVARSIFALVFAAVVVIYSTSFEVNYSQKLIDLYLQPWWRMLVVFLVIASSIWCPRVGILVALAVFFYLSDMETLITPFVDMDTNKVPVTETQ